MAEWQRQGKNGVLGVKPVSVSLCSLECPSLTAPKVGTQNEWINVSPIEAVSEAGGNKMILRYVNPLLKCNLIVTK
jgi:hypothetical protein